jgi:hypothetical protein
METSVWIFIAVAVFAVLAFISYMRRQMQKSKQIDKTIDYSKMRSWKDEDYMVRCYGYLRHTRSANIARKQRFHPSFRLGVLVRLFKYLPGCS